MLLDEEVFAVILALSITASALGIALTLKPGNPEPFTAIGLLNEECKIGRYPAAVVNGSSVRLCISVANYLGHPAYFKVVYKLATNETLPNSAAPSPEQAVMEWRVLLNNGEEIVFPITIPVHTLRGEFHIALVFELWVYNTSASGWSYTGRWNHLYINIVV
jgi:uncharacterized membrane protein